MSPEKDVCTQDFAYRNENAGLLDPARNPLPVKAKARLVIQGQHCPDNALRFGENRCSDSAQNSRLRLVSSMGWCRSLRGVDVACAFSLCGKPQEVEEPLFFEPPSRGLPGIGKGALIQIVKGVGWWKELRDTLQGDSWKSLGDPAFFCLRDCSGHLIGMIIVHVDDMLLATNNSHQAESHISRLLSKYDDKDVKRTDDGGGVLYCGKRVRMVCPCNKTRWSS